MTTHDRRYVIIGNGIAGTTAADTLRKNDPNCSIHLLTNEPYPLYNRVSLPRFLQGVIVEQKVMIRDFAWHEQRNINLVTETMVTEVNTDERVIVTGHGQKYPYDALLVATGGWANPLRIPGVEGTRHIYNFVTLDDTKTIIARVRLILRVVKLSITSLKSLGSMSYMETKSNRSYPKMVFQHMSKQRKDERSRQMFLVLAWGSR